MLHVLRIGLPDGVIERVEVAAERSLADDDALQPFGGRHAEAAGHNCAEGKAMFGRQLGAVHLVGQQHIAIERAPDRDTVGELRAAGGCFGSSGTMPESVPDENYLDGSGRDAARSENLAQRNTRPASGADAPRSHATPFAFGRRTERWLPAHSSVTVSSCRGQWRSWS